MTTFSEIFFLAQIFLLIIQHDHANIFSYGKKKKALGDNKKKEIQCLGLQMTDALAVSAPQTAHLLYIKRIKKQPGFGPKVSSRLLLAPQAPGVASRLEYCHPSLVIHSVHVDWVSLHRNLILIPKLWGIGQQTINHLTQRRELNPGNLHVAEHKNLSCFKIANLREYCPFYSYQRKQQILFVLFCLFVLWFLPVSLF